MTIVLVHGVPETAAVWDPLHQILGRSDVEAVQLPGFGAAAPQGFGATKEEYVSWLLVELERIAASGPIDLVGHDWGGGFVVRVVSTRPELVRSWVTDAAAIGDPTSSGTTSPRSGRRRERARTSSPNSGPPR
jgi:pimeloyl-ACP methyl ester carboxylesterase